LILYVHFVEFVDAADSVVSKPEKIRIIMGRRYIKAPASMQNSPVSGSFKTEAVRPAAVLA
jgi:hypothetical protein